MLEWGWGEGCEIACTDNDVYVFGGGGFSGGGALMADAPLGIRNRRRIWMILKGEVH